MVGHSGQAAQGSPLRQHGNACIWPAMAYAFDMDDRARLPWRFYGATCTILARI